jgi:hypothetical protein
MIHRSGPRRLRYVAAVLRTYDAFGRHGRTIRAFVWCAAGMKRNLHLAFICMTVGSPKLAHWVRLFEWSNE